jgi:transposase
VGQGRYEGRLAATIAPKGFLVLPRRWVVERTFSWIDHNRRMSLGTTRGSYVRAAKRWYMLP